MGSTINSHQSLVCVCALVLCTSIIKHWKLSFIKKNVLYTSHFTHAVYFPLFERWKYAWYLYSVLPVPWHTLTHTGVCHRRCRALVHFNSSKINYHLHVYCRNILPIEHRTAHTHTDTTHLCIFSSLYLFFFWIFQGKSSIIDTYLTGSVPNGSLFLNIFVVHYKRL